MSELPNRGRSSLYGPLRLIVRVGPHEADGTREYLECGHVSLVNPQFDASFELGNTTACYACRQAEYEADPTIPRPGESIASYNARLGR